MKTVSKNQDYAPVRSPSRKKTRTAKGSSRKSGIPFYHDLKEFLLRNQITTVNEYGTLGICGTRIC